MARILLSALAARKGGGLSYLQDLVTAFRPGPHRLSILSPCAIEGLADRPDVEWIRTPFWTLNPISRFLVGWVYFRFLWSRRREFDVVLFAGGSFDAPLPMAVPTVVVFRNMLPFDRAARRRYRLGWMRVRHALLWHVQGWAMKRADLVIFISEHGRRVIDRAVGRRRGDSVVIHHAAICADNALDSAIVRRLPERFVLYLSSVDAYKAQVELVEAWARLRSIRPTDEKLLLVGPQNPSYARWVREAIRKHGLDSEVVLFGAVPSKYVFELAKRSHLNLFLSSCENCPISMIELMSGGRPILVSEMEPMKELGGPGLEYVNPYDIAAVARGIARMLDDCELRQQVALAAEERSWFFRSDRSGVETWRVVLAVAERQSVEHSVSPHPFPQSVR
ncbi:MAG TPA: glycosyltransferase [Allosphingosinicella sp.]|jgi:glycosyltransferase involved in cell wall biosynthesis